MKNWRILTCNHLDLRKHLDLDGLCQEPPRTLIHHPEKAMLQNDWGQDASLNFVDLETLNDHDRAIYLLW